MLEKFLNETSDEGLFWTCAFILAIIISIPMLVLMWFFQPEKQTGPEKPTTEIRIKYHR
jgi:predicted MFS family arabinose efflux permease